MATQPPVKRDRRGALPGQHGVPAFQPTDEQRRVVIASVAAGIPQSAIAVALNVSPDTLQRHFRAQLDEGKEAATASVAGALFAMATDLNHKDCQRAAQFWLQAQAKWRTRDELVHQLGVGADGSEGQPDPDAVQPTKITLEFVGTRPKGLPGAAPEDQ